ncbi:putative thioredoxin related protein [Burkholderiales bacterium]|nr:putative thioredoxin related protein [Burkholderiales bacterium]
MKHRLLTALLSLACASLLAAPVLAATPASPALAVKTLAGEDFDLAKLQGHVVLIHFWATWCPPCIKEMPALEAFYERYRARGVEVIAMSEDRTRDIDAVHHMVHHMSMSYPVAMAHQASANSFGDPSALPVTFVVDAKGVVRAEMRPDTQPVTEENLIRIVDPLLTTP